MIKASGSQTVVYLYANELANLLLKSEFAGLFGVTEKSLSQVSVAQQMHHEPSAKTKNAIAEALILDDLL